MTRKFVHQDSSSVTSLCGKLIKLDQSNACARNVATNLIADSILFAIIALIASPIYSTGSLFLLLIVILLKFSINLNEFSVLQIFVGTYTLV